jgi:WD40 repeat protein
VRGLKSIDCRSIARNSSARQLTQRDSHDASRDFQVNALCLSPDACQLVAAGWQHIRIYDLTTAAVATPVLTYEGVNKNVVAVGFQVSSWSFGGL